MCTSIKSALHLPEKSWLLARILPLQANGAECITTQRICGDWCPRIGCARTKTISAFIRAQPTQLDKCPLCTSARCVFIWNSLKTYELVKYRKLRVFHYSAKITTRENYKAVNQGTQMMLALFAVGLWSFFGFNLNNYHSFLAADLVTPVWTTATLLFSFYRN